MKPLLIVSCPIDTYSGYGARSRDVVKAIIEQDKFDVKILPQRWGSTPWNFIKDHQEEWAFLESHLLPQGNQLPAKPKVWVQISVPNEFTPVGDYNIGITAGIETTICHNSWIDGLNRMDLNLVSSEHAKNTFESTRYTQQDKQGNNLGDIFLKKPVEVLFEGANLDKYFPSKETNSFDLSQVKESFAYLFVGHWLQGDLGEDRKNVGLLVKAFYETFKNKKKAPALILKTSTAGASYMDRDTVLKKIHQIRHSVKADTLPNIYLVHGELSDKEVNDLYNHKKVKAMVSLTKGEGFGRPLLEFSLTKKPIIATNWSGHIDFLDSTFTSLIEGELTNVHESAAVKDVILKESHWFSPNHAQISARLIDVFENYKKYEKGSMLQYHRSKNQFSYQKMVEALTNIFDQYIPEFPSAVQLTLPKLEMPKIL